jgi:hypothetical protein
MRHAADLEPVEVIARTSYGPTGTSAAAVTLNLSGPADSALMPP